MIKNFDSWLNESETSIPLLDEILEEMNRRKMFPIVTSTERQHKNGTLVVEFTGKDSEKFMKRCLDEYNMKIHPKLMPYFLGTANTGTPYTIRVPVKSVSGSEKGTVKHKTGPGVSYEFDITDPKSAVDWIEKNAMHYVVHEAGNRFVDFVDNDYTEIDVMDMESMCEKDAFDVIKQTKKLFPNLYKRISSELLFFCILSTSRGYGKVKTITSLLGEPNENTFIRMKFQRLKQVFMFDESKEAVFTVDTDVTVSKDKKWKISVWTKMHSYKLSFDIIELSNTEEKIREKCNSPEYKELLHDMRGYVAGKTFGI